MKGRSKYNNKKTVVDGIKFDSKKEAARYLVLKDMERCGEIADLKLQVKYDFVINGMKVCWYKADFVYLENGKETVEDCKGFKTDVYKIKKKLLLACHNIEIKET